MERQIRDRRFADRASAATGENCQNRTFPPCRFLCRGPLEAVVRRHRSSATESDRNRLLRSADSAPSLDLLTRYAPARSVISLVFSGDRTWLPWRRNRVGRQKKIGQECGCAIDAARSAAQAGTLVHHHERKDQTVRLWKSQ